MCRSEVNHLILIFTHMLLSEQQLRSIIRKELQRKSPAKVNELVNEGLFDFLGDVFKGLMGAMTSAFKMYTDIAIKKLEVAKDQAIKNANVPVPQNVEPEQLDPKNEDQKAAYALTCIGPHASIFTSIKDSCEKIEKASKIIPGKDAKPEESEALKELSRALSVAVLIAKDYSKLDPDPGFAEFEKEEALPPDQAIQRIISILNLILSANVIDKLTAMLPEEVSKGMSEPITQYISGRANASAAASKVSDKLKAEAAAKGDVKESKRFKDHVRAKIMVHDIMWS